MKTRTLLAGLLLLVSKSWFGQVNFASSLTACYALDGNANDPINILNGNISAVTPTVDRANTPNAAMSFSGDPSSYILLPNNPLLKPAGVSLSAWVKTNVTDSTQVLIFTNNGCSMYQEAYQLALNNIGTGQYRLQATKSTSNCVMAGQINVNSTATLVPNTWYHVGAYIGADSIKVYVNGALNGYTANANPIQYNPGAKIYLGGTALAQNNPFNGSMDNVRFYQRKLNGAEFAAIYNQDPICLQGLLPVASFSYAPANICLNDVVTLTDLSVNTPTAWAWQMTGGTPSVSAVNNPTVSYSVGGSFTISLVASNSWGASNTYTQAINVQICTGIEQNVLAASTRFFPNPAKDQLDMENNGAETILVKITDVYGKELVSKNCEANTSVKLNIDALSPGIYFISCKSGNNSVTKKFVKD